MGITQDDTNLGWGKALARELGDVLDHVVGSSFEPRRRSAAVGESGGRLKVISVNDQVRDKKHAQMPFPGACMRPIVDLTEL